MKPGPLILFYVFILCSSCMDYTPKPKGYPRIQPPPARYVALPVADLPYSFAVSDQVAVELPPEEQQEGWINLAYPAYNAKIYCSYLRITSGSLREVIRESEELVQRHAMHVSKIHTQAYENPEHRVYGSLFFLEGETASPLQFMLTDSSRHFFRGALFYNCTPNADSLAPVTQFLRQDILEIIETFYWK